MTSGCLSIEALESLAIARHPDAGLMNHVEGCAGCRAALARIREDNRFLSSFASGLGLPAAAAAQPGRVNIPGYEIAREIHRGGQGVVYEALQLSTKRAVAIKVMKQGPFATLADRARFDREIETLSRLNHPNIVAVHDAGVVDGIHYFVMNYVDGAALDDAVAVLRRTDEGSVGAIVDLFINVCDAVHAAHLRGVIHRDLKPSNIRVDRAGAPHVLDFGLAKSTGVEAETAMTRTGQFVGSLPWASPEQVEGVAGKIDLRTDVYSLGAILYQLLTGTPPIDVGSNLRDALDRIMFREPQRPSLVLSSSSGLRLDDELDTIVLKCLSKDRERRYQSAGELSRDLRRYRSGEAIEAKRDSALYVLRKTLRRYRLRVGVAAAFLVMLVVFAVVMTFLYQRSAQLEHQARQAALSASRMLGQSNVEQGRMACALGNLAEAERLLWRELFVHRGIDGVPDSYNAPPGPSEVYWALLELYRRFPCRRALLDSLGSYRNARLASDGVSLFTSELGGVVFKLDEHGAIVDGFRVPGAEGLLQVAPDGRTVVSAGLGRFRVWRRDDLRNPLVELPPSDTTELGGLSFSSDGRRIAILIDGRAVVWSVDPPGEVTTLTGRPAPLTALALSGNGARLAARDRTGSLILWELDTEKEIARGSGPGPARPLHDRGTLLFSPDDTHLADAWLATKIRIWDLTAAPPTAFQLADNPGDHPTLSFSPDGRRLAVGDMGGTLRVYDTISGTKVTTIAAYAGRLRNAFYTRDGTGVWTCGDRELRLWDMTAGDVRIQSVASDQFHCIDVSPRGDRLVCTGSNGALTLLDAATLNPTVIDFGPHATLATVAWSPDGRWIAAGGYDNAAFLWSAADWAAPPRRLDHPSRIGSLRFSGDSARLVTACDDGAVRVWKIDVGVVEHEFSLGETRIPQIDVDPRSLRIAATGYGGVLYVIDAARGSVERWSAPSGRTLRAVRFSADGRRLYSSGDDRVIREWDADTGKQIATMTGHKQQVYCIDITSDGLIAAAGDAGGVIRLWNVADGRPLATLEGHNGPVMSLRFAPGGRRIYSVSTDRTIRAWDLDYYRPHIAGQVLSQLQKLIAPPMDESGAVAWKKWAAAYGETEDVAKPR